MKNIDREDIVLYLMVLVQTRTGKFPRSKKLAVDRYMRTFKRSLTKFELEFAYQFCINNNSLTPDMEYKIDQANEGYSRYITRRGSVYYR